MPPTPAGACGLLVDEQDRPLVQRDEPSQLRPRWTLRESARERRKLDEQCGVVGPIVLRAASGRRLPSPPPAPLDRDTLVIVSWNVHVGGGDILTLARRLESGALTGRPVTHYVLLLQEAYRGGSRLAPVPPGVGVPRRIAPDTSRHLRAREDIVRVANTLDLALYYVPSMRNGAGAPDEDRGNAILSTLPLGELSAVELPFTRQRRVAIAATVNGSDDAGRGWRLRLMSLHLDALAGPRRLWIFASGWRAHQARAALAAFDTLDASAGEATAASAILGGDLNTWFLGRWEPAYRRIERRYPDTRATVTPPGVSAHGRLDFLFYRLPDEWTSRTGRPLAPCAPREPACGSDHRPIVGVLTLPH